MADRGVLDPLQLVLVPRRDLLAHAQPAGTKPGWIVEDPVRHRFYRLGPREYAFFARLDGKCTVAEAATDLANSAALACATGPVNSPSSSEGATHAAAWSGTQATAFAQWLMQTELAAPLEADPAGRPLPATTAGDRWNPLFMRVTCLNPDAWLERWRAWLEPLAGRGFFAVWCAAIAWGMACLIANGSAFWREPAIVFDATSGAILLGVWVLLKVWHELFHAIACKRFGGHVPRAGALFVLGVPSAFVDVSSAWRIASRRERIFVSLAGMYAELFAAAVAMIYWSYAADGVARHLAHTVVLLASLNTIVFNGNPLMRLDAYYALSDAWNKPNLAAAARDAIVRWLTGAPASAVVPGARSRGVLVYGIASALWRTFTGVSAALALVGLWGGWGAVPAIAFLAMWIGMPAWIGVRRIAELERQGYVAANRMRIGKLAAVGIAGIIALGLWAPGSVSLPAVVEYSPEAMVRVATPGFLEEIMVADGASVQPGQTLFKLRNPELEAQWSQTKLSLEEARQRVRIHLAAHDHGKSQAEEARRRGFEEKLRELSARREQLQIVAERAGQVIARHLADRQGTWLETGTELAMIAGRDALEIVALADDHHAADQLAAHVDGAVWAVRPGDWAWDWGSDTSSTAGTSDVRKVAATLTRVDPAVQTELHYPALAAAAGGPLPVRLKKVSGSANGMAQQSRYELIDPAVRAVAKPDDSTATLYAGEVLRLHVPIGEQSWLATKFLAASGWFRDRIREATEGKSK